MFSKFFIFSLSAFISLVFTSIVSISLAQANVWDTTKTFMPTSRALHKSCAVNGKIYVLGGVTGVGCDIPISKLEVYDPITDTWSDTLKPMPTARESFGLSAVNGKIYAIGGQTDYCTIPLSTVEVYDPLNNTWDTKTPMTTPRGGLSTSVVNGKIYAIGGHNQFTGLDLKTVEEYDPLTNNWTSKTDMPRTRMSFSTVVVDEKIYAFKQWWGGPDLIDVYDPATDTWETINVPIQLGADCSAVSINDSFIYTFGGLGFMTDVWRYSLVSNTWLSMSSMPTGRADAPATEVNGKIYVIGGSTTDWPSHPASMVEEYNPHNDLITLIEYVDVDKSYAIPGVDSVLITAKINDPTGITLFAEINNPAQTPVDSVELFYVGDSLFANSWLTPPVEESNYYIDLQITRIDSDTVVNHLNNMALFTTIGPVVVEDYIITSNDTVPQPGDHINFKLELHNNGLTATAFDIMAVISTNDSCIIEISDNSANYDSISAGGSVIPPSGFEKYTVKINPNCSGDNDVGFNVDIYSEGNYFWGDSFDFHIYKVTAILDEGNSLPDKYVLHQNYPNPFNPTTKIKFIIPKSSLVCVKVYDVLGKEVVTLVNDERPAGQYEIDFNATGLPSGIYFYRLQAGNFVEIKKMVLMK